MGCGNIGSVVARDFSEYMSSVEVVLADKIRERAEAAASSIKGGIPAVVDVTNFRELVGVLKDFDLVVGALPGDYGFQVLKAAVDAGVNIVDVSFMPENPIELKLAAEKAGVTIVPDCGVAPGLSNLLLGHAVSKLDKIQKAHIMVGGLPELEVPPLGYSITWSAEGLIDEYVRSPRIVEGGSVIEVPPLSGLEEVEFIGLGTLEAFYTDGLRTLLSTIPKVESMWEKTLRYPGHVKKIKLLMDLGFFDEELVTIGDTKVSPRFMTAKLLERSLKLELDDILIMTIDVAGESQGDDLNLRYSLLEKFDKFRNVTAMARTTAYTASIVGQKLLKGVIEEKGVVPPEKLGMSEKVFEEIISELKIRDVIIEGI